MQFCQHFLCLLRIFLEMPNFFKNKKQAQFSFKPWAKTISQKLVQFWPTFVVSFANFLRNSPKISNFLFQPKDGVAVLLIRNAQPANDGGNYSCRVSTPLDEAAASAQVLVRTATQPLVSGGRIQRYVGEDVEMLCRADVDPELSATLQWYKDSVLLATSGVAQRNNQIEHSLRLAEAIQEDEADYACQIQTSLETVEVKYRLDVYTVPKAAAVGAGDQAASQAEVGKMTTFDL